MDGLRERFREVCAMFTMIYIHLYIEKINGIKIYTFCVDQNLFYLFCRHVSYIHAILSRFILSIKIRIK